MTPKMLSESLGDEDIQPKTHLESDKNRFHGIYRGILVSNPNTIFLKEGASSLTLFKTNVRAQFFLSNVTGNFELPSTEDLKYINLEAVTKSKNVLNIRYFIDYNYQYACHKLGLKYRINDSNNL